MNKIKFRAWNGKVLSRWTIGQLLLHPPTNIESFSNCVWMQFTGLLDKNGKEIFEGDIVNYQNGDNKYECEVRWKDYAFELNSLEHEDCEFDLKIHPNCLEVIGNLYGNRITKMKKLKNPFKNKDEARRFFGLSVKKECCEQCYIELTYKEAMVRNNCKNADCSCHQIKEV